jgi:glycosyltransferase involved in cell wall biosynthesis
MTARLDPGERLTHLVHNTGMGLDALSLPDLPPDVHAALYHCAMVTVHPSFFEGGIGVFPFAESVSLGTPCLMARGPHSLEFLEQEPTYEPFIFDPYNVEALVALIRYSIENRVEILDTQVEILNRLLQRNWATVADEYSAIISAKKRCHDILRPPKTT